LRAAVGDGAGGVAWGRRPGGAAHAREQNYERRPGEAARQLPSTYQRRQPERTVRYRAVRDHLQTFLSEARERGEHGFSCPASSRARRVRSTAARWSARLTERGGVDGTPLIGPMASSSMSCSKW